MQLVGMLCFKRQITVIQEIAAVKHCQPAGSRIDEGPDAGQDQRIFYRNIERCLIAHDQSG